MQTQVLINCDNSGGKFNSTALDASFIRTPAARALCEMYPIMSERERERASEELSRLEKQKRQTDGK
jgi:hypothetical protein